MADQSWILRDLHSRVHTLHDTVHGNVMPRLTKVEESRKPSAIWIWTEQRSIGLARVLIIVLLIYILPVEKITAFAEIWKATK